MANMSDFKSAALVPMLSADFDSTPHIFFKESAVQLSSAVNALDSIFTSSLPTEKLNTLSDEQLIDLVSKKYDTIKNNPKYNNIFSPLNSLSHRVGDSLVSVFNILKNDVQPEVESLKMSVEARMLELEDKDPKVILLNPTPNFSLIEWDNIINTLGGTRVITDMYKDITTYESSMSFSDTTLGISMIKPNVITLNIHAETMDDIRKRLYVHCKDEMARERLETLINIITDKNAFTYFFDPQMSSVETTTNLPEMLQTNIQSILEYYPLLLKIKKTVLNISDELAQKWHNNIDYAEKMFWLIGHQILAFRKHYQNALVIDRTHLNSDNITEFKHHGNTEQHIANYLAINHPNDKSPITMKGITNDEIEARKKADQEELDEQRAANELENTNKENKYLAQALHDVLENALHAVSVDHIPEHMTINDYIEIKQHLVESTINQINTTGKTNLEKLLYNFVLSCHYDGTTVEKAHKLFGDEVMHLIAMKKELSEEDLKMIDVKVGAALASEFFMNNIFQSR